MKKEIFRSSQFIRKGKDSPKKESFIVFQENRKQKFESIEALLFNGTFTFFIYITFPAEQPLSRR